jgi:hypothetical protein
MPPTLIAVLKVGTVPQQGPLLHDHRLLQMTILVAVRANPEPRSVDVNEPRGSFKADARRTPHSAVRVRITSARSVSHPN